ncbi:MAG: copper homeostasis protein CutC [Longicatena sp.]
MKQIEICCGSYYDCLQAALGGAKRVELNSSLYLGGLTPSLGSLLLTKDNTSLQVITMVRPRGAGFCYDDDDFTSMLVDAELMLANGADGIAFGCLDAEGNIALEQTREMVELIHKYHKEAVFHRAYDCVKDPYQAMDSLISLGVERVLTSGLEPKAMDGKDLIKELQERYGNKIEILAGSGMNASNVNELMDYTHISQVHSSCKDWLQDPTTNIAKVNYAYAPTPHESDYDVVSKRLVEELMAKIK